MAHLPRFRGLLSLFLLTFLTLVVSACNLTSAPEQQLQLTEVLTNTPLPTRTEIPTSGLPTTFPIGTPVIPTAQAGQLPPTSVALPPVSFFPTSTPLPISIVILSPIPGNVVAGNIQVLGAAIHPQFLQYQLEYGPDPNPGNLWYPASGIVQTPVLNGILGTWNTTVVQDSIYQLRLRVTLRDGSNLATIVNNIRVQNQAPTPIPSNTPTIPRPIAAFTQDRASGQAPLVVHFLNQSSGSITSYSWTFGDGGSSPDASPTYTFRNPGVYNVTLFVTGPGGTSNVSRQINVQSANPPVAGFTQDKTSGPSPLTIQFTNQSTGAITAYSWTFGDGGTSTDQSPNHEFDAVGTYNVILSVTGTGGTSSVTRKITVEDPVVPAPDAIFASDKSSGNAPLTVQFVNQSTGQVTSYTWDFGDGETSVDTNPTHNYVDAGTYTVTLTAIGPGGQDTAQSTITVAQPPDAPTASFTQDKTSGDIPLIVQFTNQSTGAITAYAWDFGDGSTSTDASPSHTFVTSGTYTVGLTVSGPGGSNLTETTITATEPIAAPQAGFTQDYDMGIAPLTVQFTTQSAGESLTYAWDFGDGNTSTDASPSHTFASAGSYTIALTVSNVSGTDTAQHTITVSEPPIAPVAAFTPSTTAGDAPLSVTFDSSTSSGDITAYAWDFGDGNTSTDASPSHTFTDPGSYTVTLTVSGAGGTSAPVSATISVNAPPVPAPVAAFTPSTTAGDAPLSVTFDSSTSSGDITAYTWDFGDGSTSTDASPSHTFTDPGSYTVTLTVSGAGGTSAPVSATISVNAPPVPAPVAAFTPSTTAGDAPLSVTFDSSTSSGDITAYTWDFGDGSTSTDASPSHTFTDPGSYTVTLTVSGAGGTSAPVSATISVNAPPVPAPVAAFTPSTTAGDAPLSVTFDSSTSSGDITAYTWDFGDGSTSTDASPSHTFTDPGSYTVTLTVSGAGGTSAPVSATISVNAPPVPAPVAAFTPSTTAGDAPLSVTFDSSTSSGDITAYTWDFGDGSTSTDASPSHTFTDPGSYTVTLTVSGAGGTSAPVSATISVNAPPVPAPVAAFTPSTTAGDAPLSVTFDSSTSSGDITAYTWDFGDGSTSTDASPSHTFTDPGSYTVTLTVSGAGGTSAPVSATISVNTVAVAPPPISRPILFVSDRDGNSEVYLLGMDGSVTNLTNNPSNDNLPVWSPNGSQIAFVSDREGDNDILIMNADGSNAVNLTPTNPSNDNSPVWSPNGSQIAFVSDRDGSPDIFVMNADGSNPVNLTSGSAANDTAPVWSPNGSQITFVSDRDGSPDIFVMNADGSNPVNLTSGSAANDSAPAWSPNGSQIAFVSDRDGSPDIFVMNADGSNPVNLTSGSTANDSAPAWSPDSSQIAFVSNRDGNSQLYLLTLADPTNVVNISQNGFNDSMPHWQP